MINWKNIGKTLSCIFITDVIFIILISVISVNWIDTVFTFMMCAATGFWFDYFMND
ncbi:hypothetical protein [Leuconostoc falkenbergense]|uniref:hypothetical protein n=1 Tax=Leuconostoc falkenbergense TaxID=2766470 RepID=UPI0021AAE3B2|nr:hypothetical protein [Leuconostoc falkenbergense]